MKGMGLLENTPRGGETYQIEDYTAINHIVMKAIYSSILSQCTEKELEEDVSFFKLTK